MKNKELRKLKAILEGKNISHSLHITWDGKHQIMLPADPEEGLRRWSIIQPDPDKEGECLELCNSNWFIAENLSANQVFNRMTRVRYGQLIHD